MGFALGFGLGLRSKTSTGSGSVNGNPSALTLVSTTETTQSWSFVNGATNQEGNYVYFSTDGVTYNLDQTLTGTTNTFSKSGLTQYTYYYWKVVSFKGSKLSNPTFGEAFTSIFQDNFARAALGVNWGALNGANTSCDGTSLVTRAIGNLDQNASKIQRVTDYTMNESFEMETTVEVGSIGVDDLSFSIGMSGSIQSAVGRLVLSGVDAGKLQIAQGADPLVVQSTSVSALSVSENTKYRLVFKNLRWTFYLRAEKLNGDGSVNSYIEHVYAIANPATAYWGYNTSRVYFRCNCFTNSIKVYDFRHRDLNTEGIEAAFLGDSISYGANASTFANRAANLIFNGDATKYAVYGGPGDISSQIASRLTEIYKLKPKKCFILSGTNDAVLATATTQIGLMIDGLIANGITPIVYGVPPKDTADKSTWGAGYASLCSTKGVQFIDLYPLLVDPFGGTKYKPAYFGDGVHPNDLGIKVWADATTSQVNINNQPYITNVVKSNVTVNGFDISATINPNGSSAAVTLEYWKLNEAVTEITSPQSPIIATGSATFSLTGLDQNVNYYFRIKAVNSTGTSYYYEGLQKTSDGALVFNIAGRTSGTPTAGTLVFDTTEDVAPTVTGDVTISVARATEATLYRKHTITVNCPNNGSGTISVYDKSLVASLGGFGTALGQPTPEFYAGNTTTAPIFNFSISDIPSTVKKIYLNSLVNIHAISGTSSMPSGLTHLFMFGNYNTATITGNPPTGLYWISITSTGVTWVYNDTFPQQLVNCNITSPLQWTTTGPMSPVIVTLTLNNASLNIQCSDFTGASNITIFALTNHRNTKIASSEMVIILTSLTNRVGALPATITINDYLDYASPPVEVTNAIAALRAAKTTVTTVNLGA